MACNPRAFRHLTTWVPRTLKCNSTSQVHKVLTVALDFICYPVDLTLLGSHLAVVPRFQFVVSVGHVRERKEIAAAPLAVEGVLDTR